jgi:predicted transcriptional regulator
MYQGCLMAKKYKSWELYMCLALNRLVMELDLDIYQDGLEEKLDDILAEKAARLPKSEISYEIKSNHQMTNKILNKLEEMGLIKMEFEDPSYSISITKEGVLYLRKYNEFYISMYEETIRDHYKYRQIPAWFKVR